MQTDSRINITEPIGFLSSGAIVFGDEDQGAQEASLGPIILHHFIALPVSSRRYHHPNTHI